MNLKTRLAKFLLFVYLEYVKEEWELYTPLGQKFIYPLWIVRSTGIWLISPIFIPEYLFKTSKFYERIQKAVNDYYKEKSNEFL